MNHRILALICAPAMALVFGLVLGPGLLLIRVSLYETATGSGFYRPDTMTAENYRRLVESPGLEIIGFTVGFGFLVALLAVTSGFALAIFLRSLPPHWQALGLGLILIPKTAGMLATLFGLQRWLPRGLLASLIAETYLILPYAVLILFVQLLAINPELVAAARGLGASSWQIFRRITIPLSRPGLLTAFEMTLIWGLGAFLGPLFLGGPGQTTLSIELHRQAFEYGRWPRAAAEAVGLLALLALTLLAGNVASRIDRPDRQS